MLKEVKLSSFLETLINYSRKTDNKKLEALNKVLSKSKSFNKSTYASWVRYIVIGMGIDHDIESKGMLANWISLYVFPCNLKMALTRMCFILQLDWREEKGCLCAYLPWITLYRLDECIGNIIKSIGCYHVVTYDDTTFL